MRRRTQRVIRTRDRLFSLSPAFSAERLEARLAFDVGAALDRPLPAYDVGTPDLADIWVDPAGGNDARSGASRGEAVRTLTEAWRRVPEGVPLARGVRINLAAGVYAESAVPNYWENRLGTREAPIVVRAADGPGSARLPAVNVFGCRHLQFDGLDISAGGGDVLHFEACSSILLRGTTVRGTGTIATYAVPQETLKVNQCQYVYVENCDISGAWDNAVDFVAVQYGHVVGSRIHRAGDWAMYAKGGSTGLVISGNEFFDAGTGGFTAGQGTGLEFMTAPWLTYEATDITFTHNVVHDTEGAGIGVNGGAEIVMANNTLYRVGRRSHVIEVGFGLRSCDGDRAACAARLAGGGWGTAVPGAEEPIPNRNVTIRDNLVLNPDGFHSQWQHLAVAMPRTPSAGSNIPTPARADLGLVISGNVIWNGPADMALGIEQPALAADVAARNAINTVRPVLADPARGDWSVVSGGSIPVPPPTPPGPPTPPTPPTPIGPLTARIEVVAAAAGRPVTAVTITFDRPVSGVSIDDFRLVRGRSPITLARCQITTTDHRTFTIAGLPGTHVAGVYTLRLRATGTGITDGQSSAPVPAASVTWRMPRTVRPSPPVRLPTAVR